MFDTELRMHKYFGEFLQNKICNKNIDYIYEVENLFGIPDYVLFEKTEKNVKYIVSIELKLKNWKQGLIQAFRYKNFSNDVYLIIDNKYIYSALNQISDFKKYNVGLASFDENKNFYVYFIPTPEKPHSKFYTLNLINELKKANKLTSGKLLLNLYEKKQSKILNSKIKKFLVNNLNIKK